MILHRIIFQAKLGQAAQLVAGLKQAQQNMLEINPNTRIQRSRLLTDLSGPFDTVVFELEYASLAEAETDRQSLFASAQFHEEQARGIEFIVSGHQEFYTIDAQAPGIPVSPTPKIN